MARIQGKQLTNPIILSGSFSGSFQGAGSITSASFATQALTASFAISASHEIIKEISIHMFQNKNGDINQQILGMYVHELGADRVLMREGKLLICKQIEEAVIDNG